jgi:hypothetical protein
MANLKWWGYIHTEGTMQIKRYFDQLDIEEAFESPFCTNIRGPVEATDREEAKKKLFGPEILMELGQRGK